MIYIEIIIVIALIIAVCLAITWLFYQIIRNNAVYDIRIKWLEKNDHRRYKYSYDFMYEPSRHNWYGIKFPREKDYK